MCFEHLFLSKKVEMAIPQTGFITTPGSRSQSFRKHTLIAGGAGMLD